MSKKHQPQAKQNPKQKQQIVDQQNEPFLKSLQKRIRNINKKLLEITELQQKDPETLKPEQVEKINRKDSLLEERLRLEETSAYYKEAIAENAEHYRNIQLKELDTLARALVVYQTSPTFVDYGKLSNLWNALSKIGSESTLNQSITTTSNVLREFANDRKLQKNLTTFVTEKGETVLASSDKNDGQVYEVIDEETTVVLIEEFKNEKGEIETVEIIDKIHNGVEEVTVVVLSDEPQKAVEEKVAEPVQQEQPQQTQAQSQPEPQAPATTQQEAPKREERPYRGKGNYRGRDNREKGERPDNRRFQEGEKRVYKPKYQEKEGAAEKKEEDNSSSSSSSPESRNFRKEQIRQLEDEGFIVVGKPKPKAKDQQAVHEHQHGKKYHHHQTKQN